MFFPVVAVFVSSLLEHSELGPVALVAAMLGSFALTKKRDTAQAPDATPKQEVAL
ncbi:hypothetical protein [Streptomyces sp. ISL-100]|uniref:hypothetical protein n=1 Tax=Streptomyces sp. ISL-100 TaxID=2819173 RepID=UPI001BEAA946|nr:hypothetical protein [Streptomyces sp. ISL-100]MBT2400803.1 hypothetical protein [Streptomyces sp. ISL-100]